MILCCFGGRNLFKVFFERDRELGLHVGNFRLPYVLECLSALKLLKDLQGIERKKKDVAL